MKLKLDDILKTQVDIFKCAANSSKVWFSQSLSYFLTKLSLKNKDKVYKLRELNKRDEKLAKQYKKDNIIGCTISATFNEYRLLYKIKERTGLIAIDIDKDKNPELNINKAKNDIIKLSYVAWIQLSCRGEGIWVLVPYNKGNDFKETFNALKQDFNELGYIIDNCKDETRLRLISYDDNVYAKKEVEVYDKIMPYVNDRKKKQSEATEIDKDWELTKDDVKDITVAIYLLVNYCGYTANSYEEWLLEGFRLATMPNKEIGLKLFEMISRASDGYEGIDDVRDKFEECFKTTMYSSSILGYYINKIKEYYGQDWKIKAHELIGKNTI